MKTQIIQLEAHDDTLSVRDKMDWSQTPRVLLVWPEKGKVLRDRLDLILLERYCSSHGSQLALLTTDQEVIFHAGRAGIPVFPSRRDAQLKPWGKSFREFQRQDLQRYISESPLPDTLRKDPEPVPRRLPVWARIAIFTVGVLSVLAIAAVLLPTANIYIQPENVQKELVVSFQAEPDGKEIGISGTIPGKALELEIQAQLSKPATSVTTIPDDYAQGQVVFTNLGDNTIFIPQGTILSTGGDDPILFQTLQDHQMQAEPGEQLTVEIEALFPGTNGNVDEGRIQEISLAAGAELTVSNPKPTSGGGDLIIPAPSIEDQIQLRRDMREHLEDLARQQLTVTLNDDDILLSTQLDDFEVMTESYSPEIGSPGDTLWLDQRVRYQIYIAPGKDLMAVSRELVQAQYQEDINQPDLESIRIQSITTPTLRQDENYHWQERINWLESPAIQPEEILSWISGDNPAQAAATIQDKLGLEHTPEIVMHPSWWPRIPDLPFRIKIETGGIPNGQ